MLLQGNSASPGIAFGKALLLQDETYEVVKSEISSVDNEKKRLQDAVSKSKTELSKIRDIALEKLGPEKAQIFESHLLILEDPEMISKTEEIITNDKANADFALKNVATEFITIFESMDNDYMRERAADIKDVSDRIIKNILGVKSIDLSILEDEVILIANDLTPSNTATMNQNKVLGFLTEIGGKTSHTAIMARSLEIPAVVGLKDATSIIKDGDYVVINGETGVIHINPSDEEKNSYVELRDKYKGQRKELEVFVGKPSISVDGRKVKLEGNIGTPKDVDGVLSNDGEGVGLFRTEFIYMNSSSLPTENEQFEVYKEVLERMSSKDVVIRTLDIGGDKHLPYLDIGHEENPFLGYRAIRLCLDQTDIFKTQLRALLRASIYGKLRIMFPMISSLHELLDAKAILDECRGELDKESIKYADDIKVGMMIEIPSAAIMSNILAKHVDFFSIGTNDLIQYTCAVDRMSEKLQNLYSPFHPAVLNLINTVIKNAHANDCIVGMCGEAAGTKGMVPLLLGMGLDEFSMSPISILSVRKLISKLDSKKMEELSDKVLAMSDAKEIESYMNDFVKSFE